MTNTEKIAFLENIVVALHKNIYAACFTLRIDPSTLNAETYNSEEFIFSFPKNIIGGERIAVINIDRDMSKLIAVNKKLDELKNA
jgi:hypothetical protein